MTKRLRQSLSLTARSMTDEIWSLTKLVRVKTEAVVEAAIVEAAAEAADMAAEADATEAVTEAATAADTAAAIAGKQII